MCNLYAERLSAAEVAAHFGVEAPYIAAMNVPDEVDPRYPCMLVRETEGKRILQFMAWVFPLVLRGTNPGSKPKPVNNIADLRKPMWIGLAL